MKRPSTPTIPNTAILLLVVTLPLALAACALLPPTGGRFEEHSELFVATTDPDTGATTWALETNDPAYWSSAGFTLWARNGTIHAAAETWDRTYILTKESGDEAAGYGILFGYSSGPSMLVVMINLQGEYCVGEVVDGSFQTLQGWTASGDLQGTAGVADTVRIAYDGGTQTYAVYLGANLTACYSFQDTVEPYHDGGEEGFLAVISYNDQFPETPVRVVYTVP